MIVIWVIIAASVSAKKKQAKMKKDVNPNAKKESFFQSFIAEIANTSKNKNNFGKAAQVDALGKAIKKKDIDKVFNMFIENPKLDINKVYNTGETPLMLAIKTKDQTVVKIVLDRGANIEVKDIWGNTPMTLAEKTGQPEILALLKNVVKRRASQNAMFNDED